MNIIKKICNLLNFKISQDKIIYEIEKIKLQNGLILFENSQLKQSSKIIDYEFQVFSQWGEDGIISYLVNNLDIENNFFIEFGVENYLESNTRFLLKKFNWSGLVIDSSQKNIDYIKKDKIYWQYDIKALCEFITRENIDKIILENISKKNIGLLSIDIDGNDYWVWKAITSIDPSVVVIEYNSILGNTKNFTIPYSKNFERSKAHFSNLYYGASLPALVKLGKDKGYSLVTCNSAGNNAFFVKTNLLNDKVRELNVKEAFQTKKFRESRDKNNRLIFLNSSEEKELISHLPLEEV